VVGGVDGACFLGLGGTVFGMVVGSLGEGYGSMLVGVVWAAGLLMLGAMLFGLLAYGLIRIGMWVVAFVFLGALGAGAVGFVLEGEIGLFYGALFGALLGSIAGMVCKGHLLRGTVTSRPSDEED
jgi:hypothetical protein